MKGRTVSAVVGLALLVVVQVVVLNRVHFFGVATPLLLVYVVLRLPLNTPRAVALLIGFALGLLSDMFTTTPGVATMTLTFVAFLQPPLLRALLPRTADADFAPSLRALGRAKFLTYSAILTVVAVALHLLLEAGTFAHIASTSLAIVGSSVVTYVFILVFEGCRRE